MKDLVETTSDPAAEVTALDQDADPEAKSSVIYISSLKGGFQLCLDGYPFTRHRNRDDTTYWRCVQFKPLGCKARVRTKVYGKRLEIVQREHNHTILTERRKKGVLKAMMAEKKNKTTESDNNENILRRGTSLFSTSDQECCQYSYTKKGLLICNGYAYSKTVMNGRENSIHWRCADFKKYQCKSCLKTVGKKMITIKTEHNHAPRKQTSFSAKVWTGDIDL
ncbi:hypothetical protein Bhyg_10539 [Pseudolycoriella hygida]|uniref:FLYWCH-type domain-containing protein n=1 Tax=Pseudolycoriella hygida TaxID=35572 RepID=A0A9Q0MTT0_9DIPT|nr:hypothetical protein Bhyg_10539 [Pseudolycoriella hygida]